MYITEEKIQWKEGDERTHPREKSKKASLFLAGILIMRY
jgi:hypothetical protein